MRNHAESPRIEIGLRDNAVAFGWHNPVTIVDDLGISAGGFAYRAGFQHMAAEVSLGHIGIILCFEASRLSRNSKHWAQLFEVCGHLDTLVADLDQVYDGPLEGDPMKIKVNDIQINYRTDGPDGAPWVTMSNSPATTHRMWDAQIDAFTKQY